MLVNRLRLVLSLRLLNEFLDLIAFGSGSKRLLEVPQ